MNPGIAEDQNLLAKAPITKVTRHKDGPAGIVSLSEVYSSDVNSAQRAFKLVDGKYVIIQGEKLVRKPNKVFWFAYTRHNVAIDPSDARVALLTTGKARILAKVLSPDGAEFTVMEAVPFATSPNPPEQSVNTKIKRLMISLDVSGGARLCVAFSPLDPLDTGTGKDVVVPPVKPIESW